MKCLICNGNVVKQITEEIINVSPLIFCESCYPQLVEVNPENGQTSHSTTLKVLVRCINEIITKTRRIVNEGVDPNQTD